MQYFVDIDQCCCREEKIAFLAALGLLFASSGSRLVLGETVTTINIAVIDFRMFIPVNPRLENPEKKIELNLATLQPPTMNFANS